MRPDRDLSDIQEALAAYQQLINIYPNSQYAPEGEARIHDLLELLAQHEWQVATFYLRNKRYLGALWRLEYVRENYGNFSQMDAVNAKISEIENLIEQRDKEWKKRLEALQKETQD
jgi:outer membrane protein assembly factor BamD